MTIFERPILFYSEYCIHSKNFINALMKTPELFENFIRINIDVDINTRKRPKVFYDIQQELQIKISEVPTVITPGPEYVLTGSDAFTWLNDQIQQFKSESIMGFNPIEMGSFSDSYSNYGSSDLYDAKEQSFKFIGKPDEQIQTPQEDSVISKDDYAKKYQERELFQNTYQGQNQGNFGQGQGNNFMKRGNVSEKQKDLDTRLQQMIAERESFGQGVQRR